MTNRQAQVGKFSPTRSEQPKFNPNWWIDMPKTHPLADTTPTAAAASRRSRTIAKMATSDPNRWRKVPGSPNRHERLKMASILRKAARKAAKGKSK